MLHVLISIVLPKMLHNTAPHGSSPPRHGIPFASTCWKTSGTGCFRVPCRHTFKSFPRKSTGDLPQPRCNKTKWRQTGVQPMVHEQCKYTGHCRTRLTGAVHRHCRKIGVGSTCTVERGRGWKSRRLPVCRQISGHLCRLMCGLWKLPRESTTTAAPSFGLGRIGVKKTRPRRATHGNHVGTRGRKHRHAVLARNLIQHICNVTAFKGLE